MMNWLAYHGPVVALLLFFTIFLGFTFWAYRPANKKRFQEYGQIPLRESHHGE